MTLKIKTGEIWLANLNPGKGTEPGKARPVLILQDQALLDICHPSTLVIPLTTNLIEMAYPLRIRVNSQHDLKNDSDLLIDQIRAIDNERLKQGPLTTLPQTQLEKIYSAVSEIMGMKLSTNL